MRPVQPAIALLLFAATASRLAAQMGAPDSVSREKVLLAARDIMTSARYGTLVTNGPDGHPQARIVDAFAPDSGFVVWIATNALTRKVAEIERDSRVTLSYFNAGTFEYVTLQGVATVSRDARDQAAHWKPEWARLYKDENRGSDYLLLKVTPVRLEVVSARRGINNDPVTWRPTSVTLP